MSPRNPQHLCATSLLLLWLLAAAGPCMGEQPSPSFPPDFVAQLENIKEIYVATERKDGSRAKPVPVWFGYMDNALWFNTGPDSHKARRVKRGSPMYVSAKGADGPFIKTKVEIVKDGAMAERLGAIYSQKYWIAWLGLFRPSRERNESGKAILLKLTPAP